MGGTELVALGERVWESERGEKEKREREREGEQAPLALGAPRPHTLGHVGVCDQVAILGWR